MAKSFAFTPLPPARSGAPQRPYLSTLESRWQGLLRADDGTVARPFTLIPITSPDSLVAGRFLFFTAKGVPPTGVRLLEASQTTFVALVGPYFDPDEGTEVVTLLEGRRMGNVLAGTYYTRHADGWSFGSRGQFLAERPAPGRRVA